MTRLHQFGYEGPGLLSAESGLQEEDVACLEPPREFVDFAMTLGFELALDGEEESLVGQR